MEKVLWPGTQGSFCLSIPELERQVCAITGVPLLFPQQVSVARNQALQISHGEAVAMVTEQELEAIGKTLVDPKQPLQARFRALFTLRGLGGPDAIAWISRGFEDSSALLKHELAYCLGQMRDPQAIPVLVDVLQDTSQEPMVRHEAGEEGDTASGRS